MLGTGTTLAQASTSWFQALGEVSDSFLQLCMKEISRTLENQSAGCCKDGVTLHVMKESEGTLGSQHSARAGFLQC